MRVGNVVGSACGLHQLALGVGTIESDELVHQLAVAHRARKRGEDRRIAERRGVLLRERSERDFLGQLGAGDLDVLALGERVEDEERLRAARSGLAPVGADLVLGLSRLEQELLPADPLLGDAPLEIRGEVVELILDEDLRDLDRGALQQVREELLGGGVTRLVERGMRELAAHRATQRRQILDADGLGEPVVEIRQDLLGDRGDLRGEDALLPAQVLVRIVIGEAELEAARLAGGRAGQALGKPGDRVVAAELQMRVPAHRRELAAIDDDVEIDGEHVVPRRRAIDRAQLGVMLAHPGDRPLDLFL